jgi:hypothetical protein
MDTTTVAVVLGAVLLTPTPTPAPAEGISPMTVALILGAVIAVLLGVLLWARLRAAAGEALLHFRCPKCKTRIRYALKRVGSKGWCPKCGKGFVFPAGHPGAGEKPRA